MGRHTSAIKNIIWAAVTFIVIICIAVSLTVMCRQIYYYDIDYLAIPEKAGISAEVCRKNYDILIDYNLILSPDTLEFEDFILSDTERIHFEEVKHIFVVMQMIAIAGLLVLTGKVILQIKRKENDFRWLKYVMPLGCIVVGGIGMLVALNWELAFYLMHKVFFRNDYWIFDVRDGGIINILPDEFFMHCGIIIMVLTAAMSVGAYVLFRFLKK